MQNNVALVTGASKGIGRAIVEKLAAENYFVLAIDVDKENGIKLQNEIGMESVRFIQIDICDELKTAELFQQISFEFGHLDVLVNNAGIIRDNMIWNMPVGDFDMVLNVNLKGTWLMCREAAKIMRPKNKGRIINIASRAWLGNRGQSNYAASKAGVISLTRVLALELGKNNILVNAIAPGLIDTPLTQKLEKEVLQKLIEAQPTKSMGKPEDIARVVSFLASEETQFITGQTIYVDGGKSIGAGI